MGDKASRWLDHTRRARRNEDRAFVQNAEDAIHLERHFAKPADVRSNPTAAVAAWQFSRRLIDVGVHEKVVGCMCRNGF